MILVGIVYALAGLVIAALGIQAHVRAAIATGYVVVAGGVVAVLVGAALA